MKKMLDNLLLKHPKLVAFSAYGIVLLLGVVFAYIYMPILLKYAPGSVNTPLDRNFAERNVLPRTIYNCLYRYTYSRNYLAFSSDERL